MIHPLNIRSPDARSSMQIWEGDTCVGLRCENVRVYVGPGYTVSGTVKVGEVYHTISSISSSRLVIRRVIDGELLETKDLDTGRPGRCSVSFLLCSHTCRKVSDA